MKKLYLTSSVDGVAHHIVKDLNLTSSNNKLSFITTAAEVEEGDKTWMENDRNALVAAGFSVTDYTITGKTREQIQEDLQSINFLYFSGGNTMYLLEKFQETNSISIIQDFVTKEGKIYIGTSAGSIIAGPNIYPVHSLEKQEKAPNLKGYIGLQLVNFVVFPHWGSPHFKDRYLNQRLEHAYNKASDPIIVLTDTQYVKVEDDMYTIVDVTK